MGTAGLAARRARAALAILGAFVLMIGFAAVPVAQAAAQGPYDGYAGGVAVHVDALTAQGTRLADVEVGVANSAVNSEGLKKVLNEYSRPIVPGGVGNKKSRAHSSIVEAGLAHAPDADNQIVPFEAETLAPGGTDVDESVLELDQAAPLAYAKVLNNVTQARWNADTCVIGEPIAFAEQTAARVQVLETAADEDTQDFDAALVGVDADDIGPKRAATSVRSVQQLFKGDGAGLGLQSVTTATIAPVTLLEGTPNEFTIEVSGPAFLNAVADGTAGGAKATFRVPLVSVIQGGDLTQVLPGEEINIQIPGEDDPLASIKVGVVEQKETAGNGTHASAVANVVEVKLLDLTSQDVRGATVAIGHMEAASNVPAGGIVCPIPVSKTAQPSSVTVGENFTVTIVVENPFACPLTDVRLVDVISIEGSAAFEILDTTPTAASATSGADLEAGTIVWNLGTIAPGKSKTVTARFEAQGAAGKIIDVAEASGALGNCNAGPGSDETDVTALAKVKVPVEGRTRLEIPESRVLGEVTLPRTGVPASVLAGAGMLMASGLTALAARRKRR